jgi:endonuclease/exonuclease/phosphatase family metal-dependent hydrolase
LEAIEYLEIDLIFISSRKKGTSVKNRLPLLLTLVWAWGTIQCLHAQTIPGKTAVSYDTLRIADYNVLNYPGSDAATRHPYYRAGVMTIQPDVLVVEEMSSQAGVNLFLSNVVNYSQPGLYTASPYHVPSGTDDTENELFYKASKVTLLSTSSIPTDLRNISEYVLQPVGTQDTVRIYVVHLKASNDTVSENRRLSEATTLRNYLNTLPAGAQFIITGDFNTYASTDKGLQKMVESETNNNGRAKDPLNPTNAPQAWNSNSMYRFIHTQSPRVRQFGGGSNGGMDDRFDIMLTSNTSLDDNIILSHYTSYGNDGNHFNDSINRLPNAAVPDSVANGLHYASDHLPIYCDFRFAITSVVGAFNQVSPLNGSGGLLPSGTLLWQKAADAQFYDVYIDSINPPLTQVSAGLTDTTCSYGGLKLGTTYYWMIRARNNSDTIFAANAPRSFTTIDGPLAPSGMTVTALADDSLQVSWVDIASDETGYRVYKSLSPTGPFSQLGGDLPQNTQSFTDTGLSINQQYYYRVAPFNALGEGHFGSANGSTLADVPGLPAVSNVSYLSVTLALDPSTNPPATQFAIEVLQDVNVRFVQANGSLGISPMWQTYTQWGGGSGVLVSGLHSCLSYSFAAKARNNNSIENAYGLQATQSTPCYAATDTLRSGWNLLSVPVTVVNNSKTALFPNSSSEAYGWDPGYIVKSVLSNGAGYWLKFTQAVPETIPGDPRFGDSLAVKKGWNIIGSSSALVSVDTVSSNPAGIILSPFYGFNGSSYYPADYISPMGGYWVKVSQAGKLLLPASPHAAPKALPKTSAFDGRGLNAFTFEDVSGKHQILYVGRQNGSRTIPAVSELPPVPPAGVFDVRFGSQRTAELIPGGMIGTTEFPVSIQTAAFPVTVSWNLNGRDGMEFRWQGFSDQPLALKGQLNFTASTSAVMLEVSSSASSAIPKDFALHENHPNPFNPSTEIAYDLPATSQVKLTIFNLLGVRVATLVDSRQEAGFHRVQWQPDVASGIYFYRLEASSTDHPAKAFQQVKRMAFVK